MLKLNLLQGQQMVGACVRSILVLSMATLAAAAGLAHAQTRVPGHTPGKFEVSPSGAATYSVPIEVPPGVAGMAPSISLNYNSQIGIGIAGLGWSLDAHSFIDRCPQTRASDGTYGRVNLNTGDRFCLDGQRLILVSGSYGAAGSEYRTEYDQFLRITANGAAGGNAANGPESFTARTKDGQVWQFGTTADSRIEAQGKSVVAAWAQASATDIAGNAVTYHYWEDNANGAWWLNVVAYASGSRSVHLHHESRPDIYRVYTAGSMETPYGRLTKVETRIGSATVQSLYLGYDAASNIYGSRLTSVQLCDKDNKCVAPTTFGWGSVGPDAYTSAYAGSHGGGKDNNITADFNGDGRADMMGFTGSNGAWHTCLSTGTASSLSFACSHWYGSALGVNSVVTGDYNGDGKADMAAYTGTSNKWHVCLSTGSGFACDYWYSHSGGKSKNVSGDFNGDGRTDMAYYSGANGIWSMCLSTGSGFSCSNWNAHGGGHANNLVADFNGDGLDDLAAYTGANGNWHVCLSNGAGFNCSYMTSHTGGVGKTVLGDFNGDGLKDMAGFLGTPGSGVAPWKICLSTGTNFNCSDWTAHNAGLQGAVGDYNGDGRTDLAAYNFTLAQWRMCLSTGTGFTCSMWSGSGHNEAQGDYNGDGIEDFAAYTGSGGNWRFSYSLKNERPVIQTITRGGVSTGIDYQSMSAPDQTVYTKGTTAAYPLMDVQVPLRLVRRTTMSNGLGGVNGSTYRYGGMRAEHASAAGRGRGNLGFLWATVKEDATGLESYTEYSQTWPYVGQAVVSETRLAGKGNGGRLKRSVFALGCYQTMGAAATSGCPANTAGLVYHVFPVKVTESSWDLNGTAMPVVETTRAYAGTADTAGAVRQFGDLTGVQVDVLQGEVLKQRKVTTNEYHPAKTGAGQWQLGRLKKASVTSSQY